jgi:hypothetical protein
MKEIREERKKEERKGKGRKEKIMEQKRDSERFSV